MTLDPDLLILGAGPAGVGAALAASQCGLKTIIVDSAQTSGGQVYRALPPSFQTLPAAHSADRLHGEQQRMALQSSGVGHRFQQTGLVSYARL